MKLVTLDYGCGISSSILDYNIQDVIVVSESNYEHVFEIEDDIFFVGHDFLFFLWNSDEKIKRWLLRKEKWEHWVWCFERIDAIVPIWEKKSHLSLSIANSFCTRILACDEDDCDKYGFDWLPQWASSTFYERMSVASTSEKVLFSGQFDKPEYAYRASLLKNLLDSSETSGIIEISNSLRTYSWDEYVSNFLKYNRVLNPVGTLKALNTRAFETLYSGRYLFQQNIGPYKRHQKLLEDIPNVFWFESFEELKSQILLTHNVSNSKSIFNNNSIFARMKSIGVSIT